MPAPKPAGVHSRGDHALSLADILRFGLPEYARRHRLPRHYWSALNAIVACRTPALGGQRYQCQACGRAHIVFHSCRNRHCPTCQGANSADWLEKQKEFLLPTAYFHVVFTLPHCLNPLIQQNQAALYRLLFDSASSTLLDFGRRDLGAQIGLTAVLHTWSQTLLDHYHLHCIVTGGGISLDGNRWVAASNKYLFPVLALSSVFRARFRDGLQRLFASGQMTFTGSIEKLRDPARFAALVAEAMGSKWIVYSKRPFAGPAQVLAYLSRYTHRVGISNRRLVALDEKSDTVSFSWKDYADGGARKTMFLSTHEFIRRLCLHILPPRFVKIRHYGFLSNRHRREKARHARDLLGASAPTTAAHAKSEGIEPSATLGLCPFCRSRSLFWLETVRSTRAMQHAAFDSS